MTSIFILPNDQIVSGSFDKTIQIRNYETGNLVKKLTGHSEGVTCLAVLTNNQLVSGSIDSNLMIWNVEF